MPRSHTSLAAENNRLKESLENAYHRLATIERRLQINLRETGRESVTIEVFRAFGPARRGVHRAEHQRPPPDPAVWPRSRPPARALRPTPGLANLTLSDADVPVIGISVCGFDQDQLEKIVQMIANKQLADQNFIPVFLTDALSTNVFSSHRYAFEYFPTSSSQRKLDGTLSWKSYAGARLAMLERKYSIRQIITFGKVRFGDG